MRISYLNYHYDIIGTARGAAAQIHAIAARLERLGHQVDLHFRTAKKSGEEYNYGGLKRIGWLRCYGHVPRLLLRNLLLFRQECQIFDAFRPEVVLAVSSFCNLSTLLAARSRRLPFVLFSEAPLEYEYSMFFTQYYSYPRLSRWVEGVNVRGADQVTCISEVLKGYLLRYDVPATKLHLVPNGVDHHAFQPRSADQGLQAQFHLQERVVVGFVGSFNFFAAVEAFANMVQAVCAHQRQVVFLFVGRGESGEQLRRTGERRGLSDHLLFAGAVDHEQVPRYLSVMDIVVCPYRGDYLFYNSSMKLLEYMAMGKATLATAQGQIKEVVHDGYNGMLLEPGDMVMMEHKLLALIENADLRRQLGSNARRTIEDQWTWDIQVSRLVKVLQLAVEGRR
jgi:glycosyltransferase involved in cell wall biosynthesis